MKLFDNLYSLESFQYDQLSEGPARASATLALRRGHVLFAAHFPGHPVLPGAVLLRIAGELFNFSRRQYGSDCYELAGVRRAKFLQVVDPDTTPRLRIGWEEKALTDGATEAKGWAETDTGVRCATFSLTFRPRGAARQASPAQPAASPQPQKLLDEENCCIIIPAYNCWTPLYGLLREVTDYASHVLVVDDGSEGSPAWLTCLPDEYDRPFETGTRGTNVNGVTFTMIRHATNRGKGAALATGLAWARAQGFRYAMTFDADGQHRASDIPHMAWALSRHPGALIVGCRHRGSEDMPAGNRFANSFSNFWFRVQTLQRLSDTQSGFRIYPLDRLCPLRWLTSRYEAELELLVWAAWQGVPLVPVEISVYYPPQEQRISHFRPLRDFGRISLLNCVLCFLAVVYGLPRTLIRRLRHGRR